MFYELNVSHRGIHLFATAERSVRSRTHARFMFREFLKRFPSSEGFEVTVFYHPRVFEDVTDEIDSECAQQIFEEASEFFRAEAKRENEKNVS